MSPMASRNDGGGYVLSDPSDPDHIAEHRRQAAAALRTWMTRYRGAILNAGVGEDKIETIAVLLEGAQRFAAQAAE
jgi:hypothetical protein